MLGVPGLRSRYFDNEIARFALECLTDSLQDLFVDRPGEMVLHAPERLMGNTSSTGKPGERFLIALLRSFIKLVKPLLDLNDDHASVPVSPWIKVSLIQHLGTSIKATEGNIDNLPISE